MKIYEKLNVQTKFQNQGSWWLMVLEGTEEEIELTYNGLYNLRATDVPRFISKRGQKKEGLHYTDANKTKAIFWSTPEKMRAFFFNTHMLACGQRSCEKYANVIANMRIEELKKDAISFFNYNRAEFVDTYDTGKVKAERPDYNYRELGLAHSFRKSGEVTIDKP